MPIIMVIYFTFIGLFFIFMIGAGIYQFIWWLRLPILDCLRCSKPAGRLKYFCKKCGKDIDRTWKELQNKRVARAADIGDIKGKTYTVTYITEFVGDNWKKAEK